MNASHRQAPTVKFFKSPIWADKLIALGTRLEDRKQEILFALSIRTALGVDATRLAVGSVDSKMDILMSIVKRQSAHERDLEEMVDKLGGRDLIMDDSSKFNLIAEQIIAKIKDDDDDGETSTKGSKAEGVGSLGTIELKPGMKSSAGKDITNSSLRHALKASLDTLLEENTWVYNMKLQEQTKHIRNALDASTHHILKRFDMGPHERILHPVSNERQCTSFGQLTCMHLLPRKFEPYGRTWIGATASKHVISSQLCRIISPTCYPPTFLLALEKRRPGTSRFLLVQEASLWNRQSRASRSC